MIFVSVHKKIGLHLIDKGQLLLKKYRFKHHGRRCQDLAGRDPPEGFLHAGIVDPRQLQQPLHQAPHLPGHGDDAAGKLLTVCLGALWCVQELRVRQDDRQGRFQFVRGVRHELLLLLPGVLHRLYRPAGQQHRDAQKREKCRAARSCECFQQVLQGGQFAGDVREHDASAPGRLPAEEPQAAVLQNAAGGLGVICPLQKCVQKFLIGKIQELAAGLSRFSGAVHQNAEIRQAHLPPGDAGRSGLPGIHGHVLHHPQAFLFQIPAGGIIEQAENDAQHHSHDGHVDQDELKPQFFQHEVSTSR